MGQEYRLFPHKEKSNLAKAIKVLDFQIEKLYEDKLKGLINDNDFSRMYDLFLDYV